MVYFPVPHSELELSGAALLCDSVEEFSLTFRGLSAAGEQGLACRSLKRSDTDALTVTAQRGTDLKHQ